MWNSTAPVETTVGVAFLGPLLTNTILMHAGVIDPGGHRVSPYSSFQERKQSLA